AMSTLSSSEEHFQHVEAEGRQTGSGPRSTAISGAVVGGVAGLIASGAMLYAGMIWGGSILPQLIAERTTAELPLSVVRDALTSLEENAKPAALIGITLGQVAAGAVIGALFSLVARRGGASRLASGALLGVGVWLVLSLGAAPLGDIGPFAVDSPLGTAETQATFILSALLFGFVVATFVPWPDPDIAENPSRRSLLRAGGLAALALPALAAAGYVGNRANQLRTSVDAAEGVRDAEGEGPFEILGMPEFYTPVGAFYVVSKNITDPTVDSTEWSLEIDGKVDNPMTLSYTDIMSRETTEFASTLECISNRVGGSYISNTTWTGFPLRDLLEEAGIQDGVVDIRLEAADGYTESIPLDEAMQSDTMLVYLMDGEPLTDDHGYPLRLIVPNIFGMKNVKWITKIEPIDYDYMGYWQERDWSDVATVVTMSRIDIPGHEEEFTIGETVQIGGVAFAGDRGISRVEVSVDGGETWNDADLSDAPSDLTWRLWRYDHEANEPGTHRILVRATDGDGETQTETERDPLPDGATGWDSILIEVVEDTDA
ncbi:MAG: molybdopterin-dependent oxidoreductase, partial [Chloroflexota bacterium]